MKSADCFFDTNILLYLLSGDENKADLAENLISQGGQISVQVLNEFTSVAYRKLSLSYAEIRDYLQTIKAILKTHSLTSETNELGLNIAEQTGFSFYDSLIISSALRSECTILYSEDMQHGQKINNQLVITNPFLIDP